MRSCSSDSEELIRSNIGTLQAWTEQTPFPANERRVRNHPLLRREHTSTGAAVVLLLGLWQRRQTSNNVTLQQSQLWSVVCTIASRRPSVDSQRQPTDRAAVTPTVLGLWGSRCVTPLNTSTAARRAHEAVCQERPAGRGNPAAGLAAAGGSERARDSVG